MAESDIPIEAVLKTPIVMVVGFCRKCSDVEVGTLLGLARNRRFAWAILSRLQGVGFESEPLYSHILLGGCMIHYVLVLTSRLCSFNRVRSITMNCKSCRCIFKQLINPNTRSSLQCLLSGRETCLISPKSLRNFESYNCNS